MKTLKIKLALIATLCLGMWSCTPDNVAPQGDEAGPEVSASYGDEVHPIVWPICKSPVTFPMAEANGNIFVPGTDSVLLGRVDVFNSDQEFVMNYTMFIGWYIDQVWVNAANTRPSAAESYNYIFDVNPLVNAHQIRIPLADLPQTFELATRVNVVQASFFGTPLEFTRRNLWVDYGTLNSDGSRTMNYAVAACMTPNPGATCRVVWPVYQPAACTDLTADVDGGSGPFSYAWSNGETTQTISVCPTADEAYTVTVTDATGAEVEMDFNVKAADATCHPNGKKLSVCHVPPGNPENTHTICINTSGVPAHVDPTLGHNSGCKVGPCDLVLCPEE